MGHQWGANHTFNGAVSNCSGGNRSRGSAYEPGSGITIMAYAGICSTQNLARHSIDTFHVKSLEVIVNYSQTGNGNTCAVSTATGNTPPTVTSVGGTSFNIPKGTPFALTASGMDAENDSITYDWQQYDLGRLDDRCSQYGFRRHGSTDFPSLSSVRKSDKIFPFASIYFEQC